MYKKIAKHIKEIIDFAPKLGIVLGSGLSELSEDVKVIKKISYSDLPHFPTSTVEGHKGEYIFGTLSDVPVILMNGRVHYYEGYSMQDVVLPVRVLAMLGVECVIFTNAAGGLNKGYRPGTIMCINDQISSFVPSPLIGKNDDEIGVRFPDMSEVYSKEYISKLHKIADKLGIDIADGTYLQITGPAYETPAESKLYASFGADAVGMSTACEAVALKHMGVKLLGISCITDMAINNTEFVTTHEEIQKIAKKTGNKIRELIKGFVAEYR